jgi:hypothetical protein
LITHSDSVESDAGAEQRVRFLEALLVDLRAQEFLTADLSTTHRDGSKKSNNSFVQGTKHGQATYMGFCKLPDTSPCASGINRRLDIKVYPVTHFPFALLYFTGSDHFNRSMRYYAKKKRWTLSDHGLAPAVRVKGDKVWTGSSIFCRTERDVFEALGLNYVHPTQRNTFENWDVTQEELKHAEIEKSETNQSSSNKLLKGELLKNELLKNELLKNEGPLMKTKLDPNLKHETKENEGHLSTTGDYKLKSEVPALSTVKHERQGRNSAPVNTSSSSSSSMVDC